VVCSSSNIRQAPTRLNSQKLLCRFVDNLDKVWNHVCIYYLLDRSNVFYRKRIPEFDDSSKLLNSIAFSDHPHVIVNLVCFHCFLVGVQNVIDYLIPVWLRQNVVIGWKGLLIDQISICLCIILSFSLHDLVSFLFPDVYHEVFSLAVET